MKIKIALLVAAAVATIAPAGAANARGLIFRGWRGAGVAARGPNGAGVAVVGRNGGTYAAGVRRTGSGGYQAGRSVQGPNGHGFTTSRSGSCNGGSCSGSSTTTFNDGKTIERSYSGARNANGTVGYDASRTGVNGQTDSISGVFAPPP